jgi:AcrR family transcriptional regulator
MPELAPDGIATRRTQAERRSRTRRALLDATLACLVELGARGTTTLEVERRAGVSRGARTHHFPNKAALLAEAIDHLYDQLSSHYEEAFGGPKRRRTEQQRFCSGLRVLWGIYQRPHYTAVLELNSAARTDLELQRGLQTVAVRHRQLALQAAADFFPSIGAPQAERLIETIHAAFLGLRMAQGVTAGPHQVELVLGALEDLAAKHLETHHEHCEHYKKD